MPGYVLEDDVPEAPEDLAHLLVWHNDLRRRALRGMEGEPIQFDQIVSFFALYRIEWQEFEVEMLCRIDDVWMEVASEQHQEPPPPKPGKAVDLGPPPAATRPSKPRVRSR